ncbi:hypothetical protein M422DRAFT_269690 [Sphaerobolus stellatus SS14]|uniref:Uncharacterized protein n=1 Tax=Sphaerobolus stellatus (strain SS14) TaxID=990650 RepID=A0A0C9THN3_SPHS4|nr:hypothetical protein M422DRAFT_269690 [Sphaerobolus stellatus SS14]
MSADALQEHMISSELPEKAKLRLPSDFDWQNHERLELTALADTENMLRMGQANDALKHLRGTLGLKSFLVRRNKRDAVGQIARTRSEMEIRRTDKRVMKWAEVYRRAFKAMERLKPAGEDGNHGRGLLKELTREDLMMLSTWIEEHRNWREKGEVAEAAAADEGKGRKELPWIWKMQFGSADPDRDTVSEAVGEWITEAIHIEWLHARASRDRFEEELKMLEAESERTGKTFRYFQRQWLKIARSKLTGRLEGK